MAKRDNKFDHVKIKALVDNRGLKISWLAQKCRVNTETLRRYLIGSVSPSLAVMALMAMTLDIDEKELLIESKAA
jgi:transcriptional regulator with XRE-family HTH domain